MEYQENMEAPTVSNTATPASDKEDLQTDMGNLGENKNIQFGEF